MERKYDSSVEESFHDLMSCFLRPLATAGVTLSALLVPTIYLGNHVQAQEEKEYVKMNVVFEQDKEHGEEAKTAWMRYTAEDGTYYDEVNVFRPEGISKVLRDGDIWGENDGKVDQLCLIYKNKTPSEVVLNRKDDYTDNKKQFDNADKYLAETKKRFSDKVGSEE